MKFREQALRSEHKLQNPAPIVQATDHHHKAPIASPPHTVDNVRIKQEPIDDSGLEDRFLQNPNTSVASSTTADESGADDAHGKLVDIIPLNSLRAGKSRMARKKRAFGEAITRPKRNTPSIYKFPHQLKKEKIKRKVGHLQPLEYPVPKLERETKPAGAGPEELRVMRVNPNIPLQCPKCNGVFTTFHYFREHFEEEHENDFFPPRSNNNGPRTTPPTVSETLPLRQNSGPTNPPPVHLQEKRCLTCGITMAPGETLLSHTVRVHMTADLVLQGPPPKDFICTTCGKTFQLRRSLMIHRRNKHAIYYSDNDEDSHDDDIDYRGIAHLPENRPLPKGQPKCRQCGKFLATWNGVREHMKTHTGEQPFSCSICQKRFSHLSNARRHMAMHSDKKITPQIRALRRHMEQSRAPVLAGPRSLVVIPANVFPMEDTKPKTPMKLSILGLKEEEKNAAVPGAPANEMNYKC